MRNIFVTSDLHFGHARPFIYSPRGFDNVWDMNRAIVDRWNAVVDPDDDVYVLGDLMLNNNEDGIALIKQLKGRIHIVLGNHDTDARMALYAECYNVVDITYATVIKCGKYKFYLSHYPTMTGNIDETHLSQHLINLFGHTHSKDKFYNGIPFMYNVACDAHNCTPVSLDQIIEDCKAEYKKCAEML